MPQYITPYGAQGGQQQKSNAQSEWEKMLAQARMAMSLDGETALGLALGKGLRYLWDQHLAKRHAKQDAENLTRGQAGEKLKDGTWAEEDVAKYHGLGDDFIANLDRNDPNGNVVAEAIAAPNTGVAWEKYVQANGLPGSRDYRQEAVERIMPTPQLNTGALTTNDLADVLKNTRYPWTLY